MLQKIKLSSTFKYLIDQIIVSSSRLAVRLGKGDIFIRQIIRQCFDNSIKNIDAESGDFCGVRTRIFYDVHKLSEAGLHRHSYSQLIFFCGNPTSLWSNSCVTWENYA